MPAKSNEIALTRVYDAPVEVVWDAWTDPKKAAKWWGPRGFTITTHSKDLKPGGQWHYTMHGPDGTDYPNIATYHEVETHKRLVYDHGATKNTPPLFRVTVTFTKQGKKTQMEMTMALATPEAAAQTKKFIKKASGNSTWDRLGEYLEKENNQNEVFIINQAFEAPIEKVHAMWTDANHISKWLGPADTSMEYFDREIAVGKTTFYKMIYGAGLAMYGKMKYLKIEPTRIEYIQWFTDDKGNLSKHPNVPTWPDYMLTQVLFAAEEQNQTRVTVIWRPHGEVSQDELKAFIDMRTSMTQGWSQSFDKLDELLEPIAFGRR